MKKVLITGGGGNLGRVINRYLSAKHDVTIFDLNTNNEFYPLNSGDVMKRRDLRQALEGQNIVVHLAAIDADVPATDEDFMRVNVMGTWNVFEEATFANISKIIFISSVAVYGIGAGAPPLYLPIDEQHPLNPKSSYGLSKLLGENIAKRFASASDVSVICFRAPYIIHETEALAINKHSQNIDKARMSKKSSPSYSSIPPLKGARSYVFAEDVAKAISLGIEDDVIRWDVFNVSAPDTYSEQLTLKLINDEYGMTGHIEAQQDVHDYGWASMFTADKMEKKLDWKPSQEWKNAITKIAKNS